VYAASTAEGSGICTAGSAVTAAVATGCGVAAGSAVAVGCVVVEGGAGEGGAGSTQASCPSARDTATPRVSAVFVPVRRARFTRGRAVIAPIIRRAAAVRTSAHERRREDGDGAQRPWHLASD